MSTFFENLVHQVLSVRYAELASSTIILYDHIVTLGAEIELIWTSGWTVGKVLFLLNRYYTLAVVIFNNYVLFSPHLNDKLCLYWFRWQGCTGIIAFVFGELILQLRLYALYFRDRRVLVLMAVVFVAAVAASTILMVVSLNKIIAVSNLIPGLPFCVPLEIPKTFYAFWIPILVSESLMCGLALLRGLQSYHDRQRHQSSRHLVEILVRDSFLYFLILFAVYLSNTVIFIIGNPSQLESAIGYSVAMSCVMGNRLVLNVRSMLQNPDEIVNGFTCAAIPPQSLEGGVSRPVHFVTALGTGSTGTMLTDVEMHELRHMRAARVSHV